MHKVLLRQLRRLALAAEEAPSLPNWREFLAKIDQCYADADKERYLSERSLEISSAEMQDLYRAIEGERDVLESRVRERTQLLEQSEARFRSLNLLSSDWFWEQDAAYRFILIAGHFQGASGISGDDHVGKTRWDLPGVEPPEEGWEAHRAQLDRRETFHDLVLRRRLPDGAWSFSLISGEPVFDATGAFTGYRGVGRDITRQKLVEEKVNRLARFDPLTGLCNRSTFFDRFDHALAVAQRNGTLLALLFIDLDRFKDINDTWGHIAGDDVLKVMAQRLHGCVRSADTLARLGGDEFVVVMENAGTIKSVTEAVQRIIEILAEPVVVQEQQCRLGASVGIALFPTETSGETIWPSPPLWARRESEQIVPEFLATTRF